MCVCDATQWLLVLGRDLQQTPTQTERERGIERLGEICMFAKITLKRIAGQLRKLLLLFPSRTKFYYKTNAEDFRVRTLVIMSGMPNVD